MLRYNWKFLYNVTKGDCSKILNVLKVIMGLKKPSQKINRIIGRMSAVNLDGWIKDPEWLLLHKGSTNSEKCMYVYLASKRNYSDYVQGKEGIPKFILQKEFTETEINNLMNNCLLKIDSNYIYLKEN